MLYPLNPSNSQLTQLPGKSLALTPSIEIDYANLPEGNKKPVNSLSALTGKQAFQPAPS
jgi:hypothetical protein